jgi:hypothetical protein
VRRVATLWLEERGAICKHDIGPGEVGKMRINPIVDF